MIEFLRKKDFELVRNIGQGGTGKTVLLRDPILSIEFVCKKYHPHNSEFDSYTYQKFLDEIKFLHLISHQNIVRVFNYYLYPENSTGYIVMEYIDGENLVDFLRKNPNKIEDIFLQAVEGFFHLEELKILHRDIRPNNFLVTKQGTLKIIDFGFSKQLPQVSGLEEENSIILNWPYPLPEECRRDDYNLKSEIYFLGYMFSQIINDLGNVDFKYFEILKKMILYEENKRFQSFRKINMELIRVSGPEAPFTEEEIACYQVFSKVLNELIIHVWNEPNFNYEIESVERKLKELYDRTFLEVEIGQNNVLVQCFVSGGFRYHSKMKIKVSYLKEFYRLFTSVSFSKKKVILNNLYFTLENKVEAKEDDLPF